MAAVDAGPSIWAQLTDRSKASVLQTGRCCDLPGMVTILCGLARACLQEVVQTLTCTWLVLGALAKAHC